MQDLYRDMQNKVPPPATATVMQMASEMTGKDVLASGFVEQEESSIMESGKKESSEWTNEKHSLYLKSIEASFVDQLYNSLDMQSCQTQNTCSWNAISTRKTHANACNPSGQFKVLQDGFWSKKKFKRENSQMKDADRPHVSVGNPWIQHFTNGRRISSTATSRQYPRLHEELGCSDTEVTDQNFFEVTSTKKENRPNSSRKRTRTCVVGDSNHDQVVPFCGSAATKMADR